MKTFKLLFAVLVVALLFSHCAYNFIVPEEIPSLPDPDPDEPTISFVEDIIPIFEDKCTSCHKPGGQAPDLTAANAYASINNAKYINKETPASSLIYTYPSPETSTHSWAKYSATDAAYVLGWIAEGALDN
jgi:hypothetical protein